MVLNLVDLPIIDYGGRVLSQLACKNYLGKWELPGYGLDV
jgi:hypothetical protein